MNPLRTAYFAGIIDGEGCLGIHSKGNGLYRSEIIVKMTCQKTIQALQDHFGMGHILYKPPAKAHYKPAWSWRVTNKSAVTVAELVLPYLITREDAAIKLIATKFVPKGLK